VSRKDTVLSEGATILVRQVVRRDRFMRLNP